MLDEERGETIKVSKEFHKIRKKKSKKPKSSWFSVIFILFICGIIVYLCHKIYIHFPTFPTVGLSSVSERVSEWSVSSGEGGNNDDVIKTIVSNEEAEKNLAKSIKKYAQEYKDHVEEQKDNTYSYRDPYSGVREHGVSDGVSNGVTSGSERVTPKTHSFLWIIWHLKDYFDLQPLRNVLIRGGLYAAPNVDSTQAQGGFSVSDEGVEPVGVYNIDTNTKLSDEEKSKLIEKETDHIANLLQQASATSSVQPNQTGEATDTTCDTNAATSLAYRPYFNALAKIYARGNIQETCVPQYHACGWPRGVDNSGSQGGRPLPLLVVAVGGEGSGHHTWSNLMDGVVDCILTETNQFKYRLLVKKKTSDKMKERGRTKEKSYLTEKVLIGYPHLTAEELGQHMHQQVPPNCRTSFDALDSFPYGIIDSRGRHMNHPDLVNLQQLDGISFRLKYLVLVRNSTDSTMSALGRKFVKNVDAAVRTVETSLSYMDAALRGIPCHKTLIVYFEHVKARPADVVAPLTQFLELDERRSQVLKKKLFDMSARSFSKKKYDYDYLGLCKGLKGLACNERVRMHINDFLERREYMWPTFAGNGHDID